LENEEIFLNEKRKYYLDFRIEGSTITYSPTFINTILKFFKLKFENKEIKGDALETFHEIETKTQVNHRKILF
jgi:hypothetical protein